MALATTCPQCRTSFRVVPDQLKLHRGFVRCGRCRHVFAGIDHLRYVDDGSLRGTDGGDETDAADAVNAADPADALDAAATQGPIEAEGARDATEATTTADDDAAAFLEASPSDVGPEQLIATAADSAWGEEPSGPAFEGVDPSAIEEDDGESGDGEADDGEADDGEAEDGESAIDYFSTKRSRGFSDRRGLAAGGAALVLAIALAAQWIVAQRDSIAARVPVLAPALAATLSPFGLRIGAPRALDALTIESFELQASAAPDVLEMRALLRNRAGHPVRWPSMQLTLTDRSNRVLVSRALEPTDYLVETAALLDEGVPAQTEWPLRLALEARDLQPAGYDYRVRLFYP